MTEEFPEYPPTSTSVSIKGLSVTALVLGIVADLIEIGYIIYLLNPIIARYELFLNFPALVIILFWGGIALSIASDIIIGVAKNKNPNPTPGDKSRLKVAGALSIIFILLLIVGIIISFTTLGRIF